MNDWIRYFDKAVIYAHKMFMELTAGHRSPLGGMKEARSRIKLPRLSLARYCSHV
jgi:hypothetical protein